jgi:hypothetical protein
METPNGIYTYACIKQKKCGKIKYKGNFLNVSCKVYYNLQSKCLGSMVKIKSCKIAVLKQLTATNISG